MKLGTILVPPDGSTLAEAALAKAMELADMAGARVLLLRSAEAHVLPGSDPIEAQIAAGKEAEAYLDHMHARLWGRGIEIETSVWYSPAARAILDASPPPPGRRDHAMRPDSHGGCQARRRVPTTST